MAARAVPAGVLLGQKIGADVLYKLPNQLNAARAPAPLSSAMKPSSDINSYVAPAARISVHLHRTENTIAWILRFQRIGFAVMPKAGIGYVALHKDGDWETALGTLPKVIGIGCVALLEPGIGYVAAQS